MLSDVHAHLYEYSPRELQAVMRAARGKNVGLVIAASVDVESSKATVALCQRYPELWAMVGMDPMHLRDVPREAYSELEKLARRPKVAFIGEVGLDFKNSNAAPLDAQMEGLKAQVALARSLNLPLNIHCRGAYSELLDFFRQEAPSRRPGLIHGYDGDMAQLRRYLGLGFLISVGRHTLEPTPMVEIIRAIPRAQLVIETDSNLRSRRERGYEPASVVQVAERVAQVLGTSADEVADISSNNLKGLLGL